jgi:hypothetical protein
MAPRYLYRILLPALVAFSALADNAQLDADKQAAVRACYNELTTAHCSTDLNDPHPAKCLNKYRNAHAGFKISPSCGAALKQINSDAQNLPSGN